MSEDLPMLSKTLKNRGFQVQVCENKEEANELVIKMVNGCPSISSIGFGNSITVKSIGLHECLSQFSLNIYLHAPIGTEESDRKALTSDFYFTSANAISLDGHIVNIDGTGNRTASTCFGPKQVVYIIGKNKITKTLEEAILRAKNAAVELAKRYKRKTPCVISGKCQDCTSPESICAVTTIHRRKPYGVNITIILVNEDLEI